MDWGLNQDGVRYHSERDTFTVDNMSGAQVMGAVMKRGTEPMLVMECMDHGSLYDLLHNDTVRALPLLLFYSRHRSWKVLEL